MGSSAKEGDFIKDLFIASTHDYILFFTDHGKVYWLKVYDLPNLPRTSRGRALANLVQLEKGDRVALVDPTALLGEGEQVSEETRSESAE